MDTKTIERRREKTAMGGKFFRITAKTCAWELRPQSLNHIEVNQLSGYDESSCLNWLPGGATHFSSKSLTRQSLKQNSIEHLLLHTR
jgi:hypothetical protein